MIFARHFYFWSICQTSTTRRLGHSRLEVGNLEPTTQRLKDSRLEVGNPKLTTQRLESQNSQINSWTKKDSQLDGWNLHDKRSETHDSRSENKGLTTQWLESS